MENDLEQQERMKEILVRHSKLIKLYSNAEAMALVDKAILELAEAVAEIVEGE